MSTLAIETVGTQAVQGGLFDEFVATTIGLGARVIGAKIGDGLVEALRCDLVELIDGDVLRNGACYERLDRSEGEDGWTLARIATDQEPAYESDTIGIARAVARWLRLARPRVRVLEPYPIPMRPDRATDALAGAIDGHIRDAVHQVRPDHLVVLAVGGPPPCACWRNAPSGCSRARPGSRPFGSCPTGEAAPSRVVFCESSRPTRFAPCCSLVFGTPFSPHPTAAARRLPAKPARRLSQIQACGHEWGGMLLATIAVVDRMERDGRGLDALTPYVAAAELSVLAWALEVVGLEPNALEALPQPPADRCLPRVRPHEHKNLSDIARNAALCAKTRCGEGPLAGEADVTPAARLRASNVPGAHRRSGRGPAHGG